MKKFVVWLVVIALVAASVAAVAAAFASLRDDPPSSSSPSSASSPSPSEPADTSPPTPGLAPFYAQDLDWESCEDDFECTTLEVPLDYSAPEGETIELALLKVPARDDSQGALVVNPGGPGAPGTDYAAAANRVFREPLLRAFDIVGFDPRGTGDSAPVDCLTDDQLDTYLSSDPNPDTAEEEQTYADIISGLGRGCAELSGDEINHVSTIEAARDLDVLRSALRENDPHLLRGLLRHQARCDLRRAVPRPRRATRPRRCRRRLARQPAARPRAGGRVRDGAARLHPELRRHDRQLLPRRHGRRGPGHDQRPARRHRRPLRSRPVTVTSRSATPSTAS